MAVRFQKEQLANGLTILGEVNPTARSAAIGFFVNTGSRDEQSHEAGVSHFLEHMMFKGTKARSSLEITYELGSLGAQSNAYTSEENTVYYVHIIPENFDGAHNLLCDMLRPALEVQEYDMEKKVILEEIALYRDKPTFHFYEEVIKEFYETHPLGNSVLGSSASIAALPRDGMKEYFDRRYYPSNINLVAVGNFDWERFVAKTKERCGFWEKGDAPRESPQFTPKIFNKEYSDEKMTQAQRTWLSVAPSAQDPLRYAFGVLATIHGDGSGSSMYWKLVHTGLAESAGADHDSKNGTGVFSANVYTATENLEECSKIIEDIFSKPLDFDDETLKRCKKKLAARIAMHSELPMGRMMTIGNEWLYRKEVSTLDEIISRVQAVSRDDIEKALMQFPIQPWSQFTLLPKAS